MADSLRPKTLEEFKGQTQVAERLKVVLDAAKERNELPDHMVFAGPPGLGKTTLAGIIAHEMNATFSVTSGPGLEKPGDLASVLTTMGGRTILFIDEIHRLPRNVEEILYPAMEDGVLDFMVGANGQRRSIRIPLSDFTLVGATTQLGMLSGPLRDRFGYSGRLELYTEKELLDIVTRSAKLLKMNVTPEGGSIIAGRSRGTPRIANSLLRRVRDWVQVNNIDEVDEEAAVSALKAFGVDELGLDDMALSILKVLIEQFDGGPVGAKTLASSVGESVTTLEEVYEPYMMQQKLLVRTPRGRMAGKAAYKHLGIDEVKPTIFEV